MAVSREGLQLARIGHCGLEARSYKDDICQSVVSYLGSYISRSKPFPDDYPHFTDEQVEAQRGMNLTTVMWLTHANAAY